MTSWTVARPVFSSGRTLPNGSTFSPLPPSAPSKTGPDREPINSLQFILAELLESLEFLALFGKLSEFLDQVGQAVQETAAEINLFPGRLTLPRRFGHRVTASLRKYTCEPAIRAHNFSSL